MTNSQVVNELKDKKLAVYGTNQEKRDWLKEFHGINVSGKTEAKKSTRSGIQKIADDREQRRRKMEEVKQVWEKQARENEANGIRCDVEF